MKNVILWIDKEQAVLFSLTPSGFMTEFEIHSGKIDHHNRIKNDKKDKGENVYYNQIADKMNRCEAAVVVGPGIVKDQFKNHCESSDPKLFNKIKGFEITGDRMKESDLIAASNKYFSVK